MTDAGLGPRRKRRARTTNQTALTRARGTAPTMTTSTRVRRELARANDSGRERVPAERFEEDDFHDLDEDPDLGVQDGDEPFQEEESERDRPQTVRAQPELRMWSSGGVVEFDVRPISPDLLADPATAAHALRRARRLHVYGEVLARVLARVDLSGPLGEVWTQMPALTQKSFVATVLETKAGAGVGEVIEETSVSRDRQVLVSLPGGTVALGVLLGKETSDRAVQEVARILRTDPSVTKATVEKQVAAAGLGATTGRLYIGWVQLVLAHPALTAQYRARLRYSPERYEEVLDEFAARLLDAPPADVLGRKLYRPALPAPGSGQGDYKRPPLLRALTGGYR